MPVYSVAYDVIRKVKEDDADFHRKTILNYLREIVEDENDEKELVKYA
jgi:hypothetical protein